MGLFNGKFDRLFNVDYLKSFESKPNWFGLGFIQLKITPDTRLHFWHPELLADTPEEDLHDHRYRFTSSILVGELTHEEWMVNENPEGDHEVVQVSCKPGQEAPPTPLKRGLLVPGSSYTMVAGSRYTFSEHGFHRINATRAVTFLERGPVVKDYANVIKPVEGASVCPFERKIEEDILWECIRDLLDPYSVNEATAGYHLTKIERGIVGEPSKIVEEALEFADACKQDASVMALVELSDLQGAVRTYLQKYHPSISMDDLIKMSDITERAFRNGHR